MSNAYEKAGVSLENGYESVRKIKKHISRTSRMGMMGNIGSFGGMFDLASLNYKNPILVSGTDGVGTKLVVAQMMDKHDTIGIDVVAMCVNDVLAQGAEPLFFLDYVAVGKNDPSKIEQIVSGVADGCVLSNCALIGGETAEMPDVYKEDEYDLAGFTVGVVEKDKLIDGSKVKVGDALVGISSSGIHSNGFSLVRKILFKDNNVDLNKYEEELGMTVGEAILAPTKIYVRPVLEVMKHVDVHAVSHITGGGFDENIPRCLKDDMGIEVKEGTWPILPIFNYLEKLGNIPHREMFNVFNMGIGMVLLVNQEDVNKTIEILKDNNFDAYHIGNVTDSKKVVIL